MGRRYEGHVRRMLRAGGGSDPERRLSRRSRQRVRARWLAVLVALIAGARGAGDFAKALSYTRELAQLNPNDPQVKALLSDLEKQANH